MDESDFSPYILEWDFSRKVGVTSLKSVVCCLAVRLGRFEEHARLLDEGSARSQRVGTRPSKGQGSDGRSGKRAAQSSDAGACLLLCPLKIHYY